MNDQAEPKAPEDQKLTPEQSGANEPPKEDNKFLKKPAKSIEARETVTIDAKVLAEIQRRLVLLTKVADKSRLAKELHKEVTTRDILISLYEDKLITKWKLIRDKVIVDKRYGISEDQMVEITFEDGTMEQINYDAFNKFITKEKVTIKDTITNKDGVFFTFDFRGKEYKFSSIFVN